MRPDHQAHPRRRPGSAFVRRALAVRARLLLPFPARTCRLPHRNDSVSYLGPYGHATCVPFMRPRDPYRKSSVGLTDVCPMPDPLPVMTVMVS